jgi:hypothetical protein
MDERTGTSPPSPDVLETETVRAAFNDMFRRVIAGPTSIKLLDTSLRGGNSSSDVTIGVNDTEHYQMFFGNQNVMSCLDIFKKVMNEYGFTDANYQPSRILEYRPGEHLIFPEAGLLKLEEGRTTSILYPGVIVRSKFYQDVDNNHFLESEWEAANEKAIDEKLPPKFKKKLDKNLIRAVRAFEKAGIPAGLSLPRKDPIKDLLRFLGRKNE